MRRIISFRKDSRTSAARLRIFGILTANVLLEKLIVSMLARGGGRLGAAAKGADHLADAVAVEGWRARRACGGRVHGYVVVAREQGGGGYDRWCEGIVGLARGQVAQAAGYEGARGVVGVHGVRPVDVVGAEHCIGWCEVVGWFCLSTVGTASEAMRQADRSLLFF